jgi:nucleoside-diphosphate-sugar epimerase
LLTKQVNKIALNTEAKKFHLLNIIYPIYNLADDESLSTNELVKEIAKTLNLKPKLWEIPTSLIKSMAIIEDKLKLPLTKERLDKLTESYVVSNKKIKDALGKELPISAREGLKKTIESFKSIKK